MLRSGVASILLALMATGCSSDPTDPEPAAKATEPEPSVEATEPGDPPTDSDSPSELMPVVEQPLGTSEQTNATNEAALVPSEDQTMEMLDPLVIAVAQ